MALTRREFLYAIPVCAGAVLACNGVSSRATARTPYAELFATKPPKHDSRSIVVFMPETPQTRDVWTGLTDELSQTFRLVAVRVETADDSEIIAQAMARHQPAALVLMNNPTVTSYREYQRRAPQRQFPPAVVVMTSFLEHQSRQLTGVTGICYEIPLITVVTNLRRLIVQQADRVGVVVRSPLRRFVSEQTRLALREKILVTEEVISAKPNPSEIKRAVRRLKQHNDLIWVLNDNYSLTPQLIAEGWLPALDERPWLPTIVGVGSLVSPRRSFGTFAVLPDHTALGAQAAGLVMNIADAGWVVSTEASIQLPLSTTTTIDLAQARERFALRNDALQQVDNVLE